MTTRIIISFIAVSTFFISTSFQTDSEQVENYFKLNRWNYPLHFDFTSQLEFKACGDIADSVEYYVNKFVNKEKISENSSEWSKQIEQYFNNNKEYKNSKGIVINNPSLCLWDSSGTIYYGISCSNYYYSINNKTSPCEHCVQVDKEKGIWKATSRIIFEIVKYKKLEYKFVWD